jgi:hypothetical protein
MSEYDRERMSEFEHNETDALVDAAIAGAGASAAQFLDLVDDELLQALEEVARACDAAIRLLHTRDRAPLAAAADVSGTAAAAIVDALLHAA